ncbi:hypothetical protein RRG08_066528 [Elysia crispata]|uniref:Uncharacterized protein n=1 Tax=Elysia crispata TaxID=231223 RepID=A0AAE0ZLQ4_9GAST|nr:hypothetical protein RRG08_066528 [Elysia crispata]
MIPVRANRKTATYLQDFTILYRKESTYTSSRVQGRTKPRFWEVEKYESVEWVQAGWNFPLIQTQCFQWFQQLLPAAPHRVDFSISEACNILQT